MSRAAYQTTPNNHHEQKHKAQSTSTTNHSHLSFIASWPLDLRWYLLAVVVGKVRDGQRACKENVAYFELFVWYWIEHIIDIGVDVLEL